jgi:hypothetical protein
VRIASTTSERLDYRLIYLSVGSSSFSTSTSATDTPNSVLDILDTLEKCVAAAATSP